MYLAPEVLSGIFSKACDIFSLGITLLELATDVDLPKGGQLWHDLRSRGPDPSLTIDLQPELRRVIQLMMTRDPDRRPGVKQLLELPCVKDAVRRRTWELRLSHSKDLLLRALKMFLPLFSQSLSSTAKRTSQARVLSAAESPSEGGMSGRSMNMS